MIYQIDALSHVLYRRVIVIVMVIIVVLIVMKYFTIFVMS